MDRIHQPQAQHSPATEPWPEGVIARYLTVAGATVDLREDESLRHVGTCTGCHHHIHVTVEHNARHQAQEHAEKCRALPLPA